MYKEIAKEITKDKHLECSTCGMVTKLIESDTAKYLRSGWPTCCGYTMTMKQPNQHNVKQTGENDDK